MAFAKEAQKFQEDKYNLSNPEHKRQILDFEREFGKKNFMEILRIKGYFKTNSYYPDGYMDGDYIVQINDLQEKYNALARLEKRRKYMQEKEEESIDPLASWAVENMGYEIVK
jgi:hypothetical protein